MAALLKAEGESGFTENIFENRYRQVPQLRKLGGRIQVSGREARVQGVKLAEAIPGWLASGKTYSLRFGVKQMMDHFLEEDFDPAFPAAVAALQSQEYYVNMMRAWYFATALAKQWDAILPYFTQRRLDPWTHAKSIQKAVESFRVSPEQKALLRGLR